MATRYSFSSLSKIGEKKKKSKSNCKKDNLQFVINCRFIALYFYTKMKHQEKNLRLNIYNKKSENVAET